MKTACIISDTHGHHNKVTTVDADFLIHCGDFSSHGELRQTKSFLNWFSKQPQQHKIFISGNHDYMAERDRCLFNEIVKENSGVHYLQNSSVVLEGIKFYGCPQTPRFLDWAFNVDRGPKIKRFWDEIDEETQVLITHGPPLGILDQVLPDLERVGCADLLDRVMTLPRLKYHFFGHLHFNGIMEYVFDGKTWINAAICDDSYKPRDLVMFTELDV